MTNPKKMFELILFSQIETESCCYGGILGFCDANRCQAELGIKSTKYRSYKA